MAEEYGKRNTGDDGWVYPDNNNRRVQNAPRRAPQGRAPVAAPPRPQGDGSRQGGYPGQGARGQYPPRRVAPQQMRARRTVRGGISSPEQTKKNGKGPLIAALLIVAVIVLVLLLVIPKTVGKMPEGTATDTVTETEKITETEAPPEPERPKYSYAARTDKTVQLGAEIDCAHAILIDVDAGEIIAEKGGDEVIYPASMTKVMTALAAIEKCKSLDDTFTMTYEIVSDAFQANATVAGFVNGEVVTVKDLLYGSILPSGADGTRGLAEYTSGTEEAFAEVMNAKCADLGLKNTHFSNSSGLHAADHRTTCHDMAIIMEAAMDNETVAAALGAAEYVTSKTTEHPDGIALHHTLLFDRMDGKSEFDSKIEIIGGKTGYTGEAGNCLVTMARVVSTGKTYVFVCAGGETKWKPVFDTIHVYRKYLGEHYDGEYVSPSQR